MNYRTHELSSYQWPSPKAMHHPHRNPVSSALTDHHPACGVMPHLFPLGYWTTMSWSSSMPQTVPVVVSVSNMPSVQPPWPCCRDCTISRSRSMLTRSPICRPPGFLLPFCSPEVNQHTSQASSQLKSPDNEHGQTFHCLKVSVFAICILICTNSTFD